MSPSLPPTYLPKISSLCLPPTPAKLIDASPSCLHPFLFTSRPFLSSLTYLMHLPHPSLPSLLHPQTSSRVPGLWRCCACPPTSRAASWSAPSSSSTSRSTATHTSSPTSLMGSTSWISECDLVFRFARLVTSALLLTCI